MGYRSNALARSLVQGRTSLFGVVLTDLANPYHTEVVAGIEQAADASGFGVLLAHGRRDRDRLAHQLDTMLQLNVDGVVVVSSWVAPDTLRSAARRCPLVMVGRGEAPVPGVDTVANDDTAGAVEAVEHLASLGHRRISHLAGSARPAARARRDAYVATMQRLGLPASVVEPPLGTGAASLRRVRRCGASAVFTSNDVLALGLIDSCWDAGVDVPGALSVVGYDNTTLAAALRPRLTTVDQPRQRMGTLAVRLLSERLGGRTQDQHEVLMPHLVIRESTAPAR